MKIEKIFCKHIAFNRITLAHPKKSNNFNAEYFALSKTLLLLDLVTKNKIPSLDSFIGKEPLTENYWSFYNWNEIANRYKTVEALYDAIKQRQIEILKKKEFYREIIEYQKNLDPLYPTLNSIFSNISETGTYQVDPARLEATNGGISGSYFLFCANHQARFVVKPIDEDIGALANRMGFSTPSEMSPIRNNIPLYHSSMREYLAYQTAVIIGAPNIVPRTILAILESEQFSDLKESVSWKELSRYTKECPLSDKEKLCSVQEFIPNTRSLFEALQGLQEIQLSDEEIRDRFDSMDVEEANILMWATYDTDGHTGNFLVYSKGIDSIGNEILGLKKIDSGLAFPEKNKQLTNGLSSLPFAKNPLSAEGLKKIQAIDVDLITEKLRNFGLEGSVTAFKERILFLKKISEKPGITLKEINLQMSLIGT